MGPGRFQPSNRTIIGVGLLLFAAVLEGVGIHHLVRTGTCSSTGYSGNYGPVPTCPAGTGAWIGFLIGGVFLVLIGGFMSGPGIGLIIPAIFMGIGAGSITVAFDKHASSGSSTFGLIFGAAFFVSGAIPFLFVMAGIARSGRSARGPTRVSTPRGPVIVTPGAPLMSPGSTVVSPGAVRATPPTPSSPGNAEAAAAFGGAADKPDAIMGAYTSAAAAQPASPSPSLPSRPASEGRSGTDEVFDKIQRLAALHSSGALTDEEFAREKAKLLNEL